MTRTAQFGALSATLVVLLSSATFAQTTTPATTTAFYEALRSATPGQRVMTSFAGLADVPVIAMSMSPAKGSPQFLLSDKPEYFQTGDGIAMQEEVKPGVVRLYVYHCPEPTGAKKVVPAVIENLSDQPLTLEMLRRGAPKPSGDYHKLAKQALVEYWNDSAPKPAPVVIPPRGRRYLDETLAATPITKDILVHGLYEFRIDQPARITTFQKDPAAPIEVMDRLPKLQRELPGFHASGAGRGLFEHSDVDGEFADGKVYDTADGVRQIIVADGKRDRWIAGRDSLAPDAKSENQGNYGVMYRLKLKVKSSNNKKLALLISTDRTGQWCDKAGAVVKLDGKTIALPTDEPRFAKLPEACMIGTVTPTKEGIEINLTYTPPGASCLPTPILLVPVE